VEDLMKYEERLSALKQARAGDRWVNIKTGRWAELIAITAWHVSIRHEAGRETVKQRHYFASDFTPETRYTLTDLGEAYRRAMASGAKLNGAVKAGDPE
jgi:hypothetical protein